VRPRPGREARRCPENITPSVSKLQLPEPHNSNVLTAEKESGLADIEDRQRERGVRGRDAVRCRPSGDAAGEQ